MSGPTETRERLEEAAVFARAGDLTAAVARARAAVDEASDESSRAEAMLALERLEADEHAQRASVEARQAALLDRHPEGA
ncbi:MAG: hypothetical protein FWD17_10940 [Polyangiaceae bacterium]|nr:hypothetical protein [Polyangiaceae bacterium]